jgi:hypothetical protein
MKYPLLIFILLTSLCNHGPEGQAPNTVQSALSEEHGYILGELTAIKLLLEERPIMTPCGCEKYITPSEYTAIAEGSINVQVKEMECHMKKLGATIEINGHYSKEDSRLVKTYYQSIHLDLLDGSSMEVTHIKSLRASYFKHCKEGTFPIIDFSTEALHPVKKSFKMMNYSKQVTERKNNHRDTLAVVTYK